MKITIEIDEKETKEKNIPLSMFPSWYREQYLKKEEEERMTWFLLRHGAKELY